MVASRWDTGKNRGTDYSSKPEWPAGGGNGRGILPLFGLLLVLTAAAVWLLAGCVAQVWTPPGQDGEEEWTACKAEPNPECLYDGLIVITRREPDEFARGVALDMIVVHSAGEGEFERAEALVATFEDADNRIAAIASIVMALSDAGRFQEAIELARSIDDSFFRSLCAHHIVGNLAKATLFDDAFELAQEIEHAGYRDQAHGEIALGLAAAGQTDQAITLFAKLTDDEARVRTMAAFAVQYQKTGRPDLVSEMLARTISALRAMKGEPGADRDLSDIVRMFSEAGVFFPEAIVIAYDIEDDYLHREAAFHIAEGMVMTGMMEEGLAYAANMDEGRRDFVIVTAVRKLAEDARYVEAFDLASRLRSVERLSQARADIAMAQWDAGMHDQSLRVIRSINTGYYRARSLTAAATNLAKAGQDDSTARLLSEAVGVARSIEDDPDRIYAFAEAATALDGMGKKKEALDLAVEAMQILETVDRKDRHIDTLSILAVDLLH